jgi:hypothetical protein
MYSRKYYIPLNLLSLILLGLLSCQSNFRKNISAKPTFVEYLNRLKTCSPYQVSIPSNLESSVARTFIIKGTIKSHGENLCLTESYLYLSPDTNKVNEGSMECKYTRENIEFMTNKDGYKEAVQMDSTGRLPNILSDNRHELLSEIHAKACIPN